MTSNLLVHKKFLLNNQKLYGLSRQVGQTVAIDRYRPPWKRHPNHGHDKRCGSRGLKRLPWRVT